jgi:hypothetical protein
MVHVMRCRVRLHEKDTRSISEKKQKIKNESEVQGTPP